MNLDQLRTFLVAADALNFTRAAELLHLTQPAVSQQIKELETHFRIPLFERRGRQVALSPAGERLRPYARDVLTQLEEARSALLTLAGHAHGKLWVGSGNTLGVYLLPRLLGGFQSEHPDILVSLRIGETSAIVELLARGELDLALLEETPLESKLRPLLREELVEDELVLIAPATSHEPLGRFPLDAVSPEALQTLPMVVRQASSRTGQLVISALIRAGVDVERLNVTLELGNTEGLKQAVMAGLGVAFVSTFAIQAELEKGLLRVLPVEGLRIRRQLWLVSPQQVRLVPDRVRLFKAFLLEACAGTSAGRGGSF